MEMFFVFLIAVLVLLAVGAFYAKSSSRRAIKQELDRHWPMLNGKIARCTTEYGTFDRKKMERELLCFCRAVLSTRPEVDWPQSNTSTSVLRRRETILMLRNEINKKLSQQGLT